MQIPQNIRLERIELENKTRILINDKPLLQEYFDYHYVDESNYNLSIKSLNHYVKVILRFLDYSSDALATDLTMLSKENHNLGLIDEDLINQFVKNLPNIEGSLLPPSPGSGSRMPAEVATVTNYKISINSFFRWLEEQGYIPSNPVKHTIWRSQNKIIKSQNKINKYLSDEESKALMELSISGKTTIYGNHVSLTKKQLSFHKKNYLRNNTMVALMLFLGLRINEVHDLNNNSFNMLKSTITLFRKGGEYHEMHLSEFLKEICREYLDSKSEEEMESEAFFNSYYRGIYSRITTRQISKIITLYLNTISPAGTYSPHKLRSTFATKLLNDGVHMYFVKELLNHKSMDTTAGYLTAEKTKMQDILNGLKY